MATSLRMANPRSFPINFNRFRIIVGWRGMTGVARRRERMEKRALTVEIAFVFGLDRSTTDAKGLSASAEPSR
jgi:hypothetical protein